MLETKTTTATLALAAALVAYVTTLPSNPKTEPYATSRSQPVHPVAALAWAQSNCGLKAGLKRGAPRLQAEDFLMMTAELDARRNTLGAASVCQQAIRLASRVASEEHADVSRDDKDAIAFSVH